MGDELRVEMRTRRQTLERSRRTLMERSKGEPIHERVDAYGQMIAATLAQPSSNFASEMHAVARRAHYLLSLQVSAEEYEAHDYVIVQMRNEVLMVGSYATEEEFLEAQETLPHEPLPRPTFH